MEVKKIKKMLHIEQIGIHVMKVGIFFTAKKNKIFVNTLFDVLWIIFFFFFDFGIHIYGITIIIFITTHNIIFHFPDDFRTSDAPPLSS